MFQPLWIFRDRQVVGFRNNGASEARNFMEIVISKAVVIPETELQFTTSRSGGPGGQHVNKVNSRVTLHFNVTKSPSLTTHHKRRLITCLRTRMNKEGVLQLHSQKYRSQSANRHDLLERFSSLLDVALRPRPRRVPTKISKSVKEKRLQEKKRHARLKQTRSRQKVED
jgi:ribosome-associated protein